MNLFLLSAIIILHEAGRYHFPRRSFNYAASRRLIPPAASRDARVNIGRANTHTYTQRTCRCRVRRIFVNQATSVAVPAATLSAFPITKLLLLYLRDTRTGRQRGAKERTREREGEEGQGEKERDQSESWHVIQDTFLCARTNRARVCTTRYRFGYCCRASPL